MAIEEEEQDGGGDRDFKWTVRRMNTLSCFAITTSITVTTITTLYNYYSSLIPSHSIQHGRRWIPWTR